MHIFMLCLLLRHIIIYMCVCKHVGPTYIYIYICCVLLFRLIIRQASVQRACTVKTFFNCLHDVHL